jgi:hypothetical protein
MSKMKSNSFIKKLKNLSIYALLLSPVIIGFFCLENMMLKTFYANTIRQIKDEVNITIINTLKAIPEYEKLTPYLLVYDANDKNGPLEFIRLGVKYDGGYVVPLSALKATDALLGYGIFNDSSFEEQFSDRYNKPSYGFDCGKCTVTPKNQNFTLIRECIATDTSLFDPVSSNHQISSYDQQIKRLKLEGKKIFIKMDIEGGEYEAMKGVLKHAKDITGIAIEIHFPQQEQISKATKLLSDLSKDFVLLHVHGMNGMGFYNNRDGFCRVVAKNVVGDVSCFLELTYINKSLLTNYRISQNQSHPRPIDMPTVRFNRELEFTILKN